MSDNERGMLALAVGARDHAEGPENAAVTLVEYGDYECPHCGRAYPIVGEIQKQLGSRLRFVFRNFPLTEMHPHAQHAAEAAEAAAAQGYFRRDARCPVRASRCAERSTPRGIRRRDRARARRAFNRSSPTTRTRPAFARTFSAACGAA